MGTTEANTTAAAPRSAPGLAARAAQRGVLLACAADPASAGGWWAERVAPAWPCQGERPAVKALLIDDLAERMDARVAVEHAGAVVLLPGESTPVSSLMRAAAVLRESARPGVVLMPSVTAAMRERLEQWGLVVLERGADPSAIAGLTCGLVRAAQTVRELEAELSLSSRLAAGAKAWIRRVDEELHLAARMQQDLLPARLPELAGFRFAAMFRPLWHVSGDIYRVERLDEDHVGFMIADAMGHGVRAAMSTMILAHTLVMKELIDTGPEERSGRAAGGARYRLLSPGESLKRLNDEMLRHPSETMRFASALCGVLNVRTGWLELAAAGHPHPLLIENGAGRSIEMDGPLLGVFERPAFNAACLRLQPGQTLLVYSDGLENAFGGDRADGRAAYLERLVTAFDPRAGATVEAQSGALGAAMDEQAGSLHRLDDVTLLAVRCG